MFIIFVRCGCRRRSSAIATGTKRPPNTANHETINHLCGPVRERNGDCGWRCSYPNLPVTASQSRFTTTERSRIVHLLKERSAAHLPPTRLSTSQRRPVGRGTGFSSPKRQHEVKSAKGTVVWAL